MQRCVGVQVPIPAPRRVVLQHLKSCKTTRFFMQRVHRGGHGCLYAQTLPRLAGTASLESPSSDTVIVKAKLLTSYGKVAPTLFASGFFRFTGSTGNTCICEFDIIIFFRQISVCFASGNC